MRAPRSLARQLALAALLLLAACGSPSVGGPTADAPISAPNEQWTWIDFPNAVCGSGQATGLGVNRTGRTTDVVLYLMGGGACWDEETCVTNPTASFLDGFTSLHFAFATIGFTNTPLDRNLAGNPFSGASLVFVPYCTGDLHAGDTVNTYGARIIHHAGHANTAAFLRRLAPTFPGARRVFLVGSSAGGYGAQLEYEAVAAAFPEAEVHLLADGAQLVTPADGLWDVWKAAWHTPLPAACTGCATEPGALVGHLAASHPDRRFGLLASMQDDVLRGYFGYAADPAGFSAATQALLDAQYAADPTPWPDGANARAFALDTARHTMLDLLMTTVGPAPERVALVDWVTAWRDGTAAWESVGP
jgi:hypothetical protein